MNEPKKRISYSTDLTATEWELLKPYVPEPKKGGRPVEYSRSEIVNAIRYLLRTGCAWRLLPHDFPPWGTVYHYFSTWRPISPHGVVMEHGRGCTTPYVLSCVKQKAVRPNQALGSWIANQSRRLKKGAPWT